jgi:putative redox protein
MGMILVGLAGCTAIDVITILQKKRQEVTSLEIEVEGDQADEFPKVYRQVNVVYRVGGKGLSEEAVARAIELSMTKYCPVNAMLRWGTRIDYRYEIINES